MQQDDVELVKVPPIDPPTMQANVPDNVEASEQEE